MRACLFGLLLVCSLKANSQEGDPARGEQLYYACASCHWADGSGSEALGAPAIAGIPQAYAARQLRLFRDGLRGAGPEDLPGRQMSLIAATFPAEQDVLDVSAYVSSMPPAKPSRTLPGDPGSGSTLYQSCAPCHGARGEGSPEHQAPPLTLQQDWYTLRQLQLYSDGLRGGETDSIGMQMRSMVKNLSHGNMRDLAAYIASLGSP